MTGLSLGLGLGLGRRTSGGSSDIPADALLDENGAPLLDENDAVILEEA